MNPYYNTSLIKGTYMGSKRPHYPLRETVEFVGYIEVVLAEGEDLYDLAKRVFGEENEDLWYIIAECNPLRMPTDYKGGDVVRIPRIVSAEEESGEIKSELSVYGG